MCREMPEENTRDQALLANRALLVLHSTRTAAHELNNVFQMIGGAAELLLANPALAPALSPRVDGLVRHVRRGEAIVRSIADLARPEGPGSAVLDLAELTNQALDMRRFEHRRAGLAVSAELQPGVLVRADSRDLVQMLLNAILCAERAIGGRADGAITISIGRQADSVEMVIVDNGIESVPAACDLHAARLLAEASGGGLERSGNRTRLWLPAGRPSAGASGSPQS